MLLLKGTEPEKESMTVRLGLGGKTSRIDGAAHILTTGGSEEDDQPHSKAGLSALTDVDLQQHGPKDVKQVMGGVKIKRDKKTREESRVARGRGQGGALGAVYRGSIHKVGKVNLETPSKLSTVGDTVESPSHRTLSQNVTRHTE